MATNESYGMQPPVANGSGPTTYAFDPVSSTVIESLPQIHKSHQKLQSVIDFNLGAVTQTCQGNRVAARSGLSYDQFLAGMLFQNEQMLRPGQFLYFTHVVFENVTDPGVTTVNKQNMSQGRLFLTNHRIMLLAAEESQGLSISTQPGATGKDSRPSSYLLSGRCSDVLHFQTVPLGCVKNVEFNAASGVNVAATLNGKVPWCGLSLFSCCGMDMCLKSWNQEHMSTTSLNQRVLTFGAALPPWGNRYMIQIHIHEDVPLKLVKDFIVDLQHFAPDLYTGAMSKKE